MKVLKKNTVSLRDIDNDEDLTKLVHTFYARVQKDERLGYIFNDYAKVDWEHHLPKMVDFWSNLVFQTGRYKGRPFREHLPLPVERNDFNLWYGYWVATVDDLYKGERAEYVKEMAGKIASSFALRFQLDGRFD